MEINYNYPNTALSKISGKLDYHASVRVFNELIKCVNKKMNVIIDMERCSFVTSSGMRMLTLISKSCIQNHKKMILIHLDDEIDDIMRITGFVTGFIICNTMDTAVMLIEQEAY